MISNVNYTSFVLRLYYQENCAGLPEHFQLNTRFVKSQMNANNLRRVK